MSFPHVQSLYKSSNSESQKDETLKEISAPTQNAKGKTEFVVLQGSAEAVLNKQLPGEQFLGGASKVRKRRRRCAVCVAFNCVEAFSCPGNSKREHCSCIHKKPKRSCAVCRHRRCLKANTCPGRGGKKYHNCNCVEPEGPEYETTYNEDGTEKKKKRTRRCTVCIQYNCEEQYHCPGNSNKKNCKCRHKRSKRSCFVCSEHGPCGREFICKGRGGRKFHSCFCTSYLNCSDSGCIRNKKCSCTLGGELRQSFLARDENMSVRQKARRRCSRCVTFLCDKAENCPGNSNKANCKCNHKKAKRACQLCKKRSCRKLNLCKGKGGIRWHKCDCDNLPVTESSGPHPEFVAREDDRVLEKTKRRRRCTVCIRFNCDEMYKCPGNSNRKNCQCNHKKARRNCATCKVNKCKKANQCAGRGGRKFHNCSCTNANAPTDSTFPMGQMF
mmetsp:Transcript_8127/g.10575  ORF Transcript_8127/g.10575 Transcript_8127/m.10575 type:complete len:442 (-) Transcript_8127:64-1389(-)